MTLDLSGVSPANVVPFDPNTYDIAEGDLRSHVSQLSGLECVNGIVCNGHAGQVYALSKAERASIVEIIRDEVDPDTPVISGVVDGSSDQVVADINRAEAAGADGILLIPPLTSINTDPDGARVFLDTVTSESNLPVVLFQLPTRTGRNYPPELLAELSDVDGVVAVKDAVWDVDHYQEDVRAIRETGSDVQVLVGNDEHLLPSYSLRADGTVLELAAVIPDLIAELFEAVRNGTIDDARVVYERMEPFLKTVYAAPSSRSTTRLKVALELQGVIESGVPRPPGYPLPDDEVAQMEQCMVDTGILDAGIRS